MDVRTNKRWGSPILAVRTALFLFSVFLFSVVPASAPKIYSSPDETANAVFAETFARTSRFRLPIDSDVTDPFLLHPRSTKIVDRSIVPESFLGLPLYYGLLAKVTSQAAIPFFAPALAAAAVVCFHILLCRFLTQRQALFGAVLLMVNPAFWYYANRGLFHNVPFVSLLIIGITLFVLSRRRWWLAALGGVALGIGISFRPSELPWILLAGAGVLFTQWRTLWPRGTIALLLGVVVGTLPFFLANNATYHSPFSFGYQDIVTSEPAAADATSSELTQLLLPFGFDAGKSLDDAWRYLGLFPFWLTPAAVVGIGGTLVALVRRRKVSNVLRVLLVTFALSFAYLVFYYGSWNFSEHHGPQEVILGSSYLRYWLPLFVLVTPFVVVGFDWLMRLFRAPWRQWVTVAALALLAFFTFDTVFREPLYGITALREHLSDAAQIREQAIALLPSSAVIVAGRSDKVFFPVFDVIVDVNLNDGRSKRSFDSLVRTRPVYVLRDALAIDRDRLLLGLRDHGYRVSPDFAFNDALQFYRIAAPE